MTNYIEITDVYALEVLDSRGTPTVEAHIQAYSNGRTIEGYAIVPSGASTGIFEAAELRDNDNRYNGKGVRAAVNSVNEIIAPRLIGMNVLDQTAIDKLLIDLDGSANKVRLGANALLAVSIAAAVTGAKALDLPLYRYLGGFNPKEMPVPMMNIMNGGKHADNTIDFQEFMIMPVGAANFSEGVRMCCEIYHSLKGVLKAKGLSTGVGDEGGFAPNLASPEDAIENILEAVEKTGYKPYEDIVLAMDAAASELYKDGFYHFEGEGSAKNTEIKRTADEMIDYYEVLCEKYPLISIEDGLDQEDFSGWQKLTERLGSKVQLVGDDLFVTNTERIQKGIDLKCGNSVLIKVNQIGTLTEAFDAIQLAQKNKMTAIVSHRSGETEDTVIADIAIALNCGQIKTGAPARTDRTAKYNRLLRIEYELENTAVYKGKKAFYNL